MNRLLRTRYVALLLLLGGCSEQLTVETEPSSNGGSGGTGGTSTGSGGSAGVGRDALVFQDVGAYPVQDGGCGASTGPGADEPGAPCDGDAVLCVAAGAAVGGDGSAATPFRSIQAAVEAAPEGATIQVAEGEYDENVGVQGKSVKIRGGFAPDFAVRNARERATCVNGGQRDSVFTLLDAGASVIDGFHIQGGAAASADVNYPSGAGIYANGGSPTIAHNVIEHNATGGDWNNAQGGGIQAFNAASTIVRNVVRDNTAGRGGGISVGGDSVVLEHNSVVDNRGLGDHGGGLYLSGEVTMTKNLVAGNEIGVEAGYGWGGGAIVHGGGTRATLAGNVFTDNVAPLVGGAVFFDEAATATMHNDLVVGNRCVGEKGRPAGAGVHVDGTSQSVGSKVTIVNATIADNTSEESTEGIAISVQAGSRVQIRNSIVWQNGDDAVAVDSSSLFNASYTLSQDAFPGVGNLNEDPAFVDGAYLLKSTGGHFESDGWVEDEVTSPAVDAGDPADDFAEEPAPNGDRINLGAFGNTDRASKSP